MAPPFSFLFFFSKKIKNEKELKAAFPNITPVPRPPVVYQEIKDPNWLAGFMSAEGCLYFLRSNSSNYKTGSRIQLKMVITQHSRDEELMKSLRWGPPFLFYCFRRSPPFSFISLLCWEINVKEGARPWGPSPFSFLFFFNKKIKKKTYKWALQQLGGALRRRPSFSTVLRE
uniref:Homing endonuclease LAGLIDADG domain-containing protein n=1 Tax=Morchella importuna TaxID=1174673 RepID=A0A650AFT9_9PEZI|nr:hypothetical protein [Morchella importuna]QGN66771.1 hypothetical protein [Morchella importuna]